MIGAYKCRIKSMFLIHNTIALIISIQLHVSTKNPGKKQLGTSNYPMLLICWGFFTLSFSRLCNV